jgi:uncharacterized protein YllA (UPF0747 family)
MLLVRNSVLLATEKQVMKLDKLGLSWNEIFMSQELLSNKKTKEFSNFTINFSEQKEVLKQQFKSLHEIALKTDKSFIGAVKAQEIKQINGLDKLEKRLLKAEKRVLSEKLNQLCALQNVLFPKGNLQERTDNFATFYSEFGPQLIAQLLTELKPLEQKFSIIKF